MNWNKVKTILIILLVALNGFLFVTMRKSGIFVNDEKLYIQDALAVIKNRGIEIDCEVPGINGTVQLLHLGKSGVDKEKILLSLLGVVVSSDNNQTQFENNQKKVVFLNQNYNHFYFVDQSEKTEKILDVTQKRDVVHFVLDYLESIGAVWDDYTVTNFTVNEQQTVSEIQVMQNFRGNLVYDNYINAIVSETGFAYVETSCYQINGLESTDESLLLRPYQVLLKFLTEGSVSSKVILIDQGFKKSTFTDPTVSEVQAGYCWRFVTEEGIVYYASLMNGQEVK